MYLTTTVHITKNNKDNIDLNVLNNLAYHTARLYNCALYNVRQHYFNTNNYLNFVGCYHQTNTNENYQILLSDTAQQVLRLVDRNMTSFFKLIFAKKNGTYSNPVKLPHYKAKEEKSMFVVQGRSCRIQKDNTIAIGLTKEFRELYNIPYKRFFITIPKHIKEVKKFKELRFHPLYNGKEFKIEFVYDSTDVEQPKQISSESNGHLSIDLGVNNLMACTIFSDNGSHQFLIDGRPIKSINSYYNKMKAKLQGDYSHNQCIKNPSTTKRMINLSNGRTNRINDYFNKSVKYIISKCFEYGVSTIVIGYNKEQKQGINIGKVNNQTFVNIPYYKLRFKLNYVCELHGIKCIFQEESYTSKANSLNLDNVPVYGDKSIHEFSGKRIKRGLYKSNDGLLLNSDINGSINILRKYFKERKLNEVNSDSIRALVNVPCKKFNSFSEAPSFMVG